MPLQKSYISSLCKYVVFETKDGFNKKRARWAKGNPKDLMKYSLLHVKSYCRQGSGVVERRRESWLRGAKPKRHFKGSYRFKTEFCSDIRQHKGTDCKGTVCTGLGLRGGTETADKIDQTYRLTGLQTWFIRRHTYNISWIGHLRVNGLVWKGWHALMSNMLAYCIYRQGWGHSWGPLRIFSEGQPTY